MPAYLREQLMPRGTFFPMCGMKLAWKRERTPAMHFALMGAKPDGTPWGYRRFDDIWRGLHVQKVLDPLGLRAHSGQPLVWHDHASDPHRNAEPTGTRSAARCGSGASLFS